jgi:hypothetical protein
MLKFDSTVDRGWTHGLGYLYVNDSSLSFVKKYSNIDKFEYDGDKSFDQSWTFERVVACLYNLSNQKIFKQGDKYKLSFEVVGSYDGKPFTLYDYKASYCVHIGGNDDLNVPELKKELIQLIKNTKPKPFTARIHYDNYFGNTYDYSDEVVGKADEESSESDNNNEDEADENDDKDGESEKNDKDEADENDGKDEEPSENEKNDKDEVDENNDKDDEIITIRI